MDNYSNNDITLIDDLDLATYNRLLCIFKFNDFYVLPRQYDINGIDFEKIEDLPKGIKSFGLYDDTCVIDLSLLQPAKNIDETKKFNFGKIEFKVPIATINKDIIYIDNLVIYAIHYTTKEIRKLTIKGITPKFIKDEDEKLYKSIQFEYKVYFHQFSERRGNV